MKVGNKNRGSATVELVFIMPLLLWVMVLVIYLMFDMINDSYVQEQVYTEIYTYKDRGDTMEREMDGIINGCPVGQGDNKALWGRDHDGVYVKVKGNKIPSNAAYRYVSDSVTYKTEIGVCEERLRRWQFYGDILWE